jgi:hypothetical protein
MTDTRSGELDVLWDISARLEQAGILYMLTGSLALGCYTTPRTTRGIDVVAELTDSDVARVVTLFEADYEVSPGAIAQAVQDRSSFDLIDQASTTKVAVFPTKREPFRKEEFDRRRRVTIGDFSTWVVTAEDLVLAKLLWMQRSPSDIQMRDVRMLLQARLETDYVDAWAHRLGLDDLLAEARIPTLP